MNNQAEAMLPLTLPSERLGGPKLCCFLCFVVYTRLSEPIHLTL